MDKEILDYFLDPMQKDDLCSPHIFSKLLPIENFLADFLFWSRNHKMGLTYSRRNELYLGARGVITKKGVWYPTGMECCDIPFYGPVYTSVEGTVLKYTPFYAKHHSNSLQHCAYMIKHKKKYILPRILQGITIEELNLLYTHTINDDLPLLINYKHFDWKKTIVTDFIKGYYSIVKNARKELEDVKTK
jgi:hypothetical protein